MNFQPWTAGTCPRGQHRRLVQLAVVRPFGGPAPADSARGEMHFISPVEEIPREEFHAEAQDWAAQKPRSAGRDLECGGMTPLSLRAANGGGFKSQKDTNQRNEFSTLDRGTCPRFGCTSILRRGCVIAPRVACPVRAAGRLNACGYVGASCFAQMRARARDGAKKCQKVPSPVDRISHSCQNAWELEIGNGPLMQKLHLRFVLSGLCSRSWTGSRTLPCSSLLRPPRSWFGAACVGASFSSVGTRIAGAVHPRRSRPSPPLFSTRARASPRALP